jgi:hypothetical protein
MGLLGIPLDIMTITIAAITIGIGVDYAIHYIHRYKKERSKGSEHSIAIHTVQTTVGKALLLHFHHHHIGICCFGVVKLYAIDLLWIIHQSGDGNFLTGNIHHYSYFTEYI